MLYCALGSKLTFVILNMIYKVLGTRPTARVELPEAGMMLCLSYCDSLQIKITVNQKISEHSFHST